MLGQGMLEECIALWEGMERWEDALRLVNGQKFGQCIGQCSPCCNNRLHGMGIRVAEHGNHGSLPVLRGQVHQRLLASGQEARAAELKAAGGDVGSAVALFLRAGQPARAATLICTQACLVHAC